MLLGITTKLLGRMLAITGAKKTWNHSSKSTGSKSSISGARAFKVRFKMVSRTPGFLMKVMFLWKYKGFRFQFSRTFYLPEIIVEMRASFVTHLCTSVHGAHGSQHHRQKFTQEAYQKCTILSQIPAPYSLLKKEILEPRTSVTWPLCQPTFWGNMAVLNVKHSPAC